MQGERKLKRPAVKAVSMLCSVVNFICTRVSLSNSVVNRK
jgi:hypothetical protein